MWVLNTCLLTGTVPATWKAVAGTFVRGVQDSYLPPCPILDRYEPRPAGRGRYERKRKQLDDAAIQ